MIKQVSSDDLSSECNKYLELKVDNVERMTALLETKLGCTSYKVTPDNTIHLKEYLDQPTVISELAVNNKIGLISIMVKEINLENYFIQLVGGKSNE